MREEYNKKRGQRESIEGLLSMKGMRPDDQYRLAARILTIKKILIDNGITTAEEFQDLSEKFFQKIQDERVVVIERKASGLRFKGKKPKK